MLPTEDVKKYKKAFVPKFKIPEEPPKLVANPSLIVYDNMKYFTRASNVFVGRK